MGSKVKQRKASYKHQRPRPTRHTCLIVVSTQSRQNMWYAVGRVGVTYSDSAVPILSIVVVSPPSDKWPGEIPKLTACTIGGCIPLSLVATIVYLSTYWVPSPVLRPSPSSSLHFPLAQNTLPPLTTDGITELRDAFQKHVIPLVAIVKSPSVRSGCTTESL